MYWSTGSGIGWKICSTQSHWWTEVFVVEWREKVEGIGRISVSVDVVLVVVAMEKLK